MNRLFIDASYFIALQLKSEQEHYLALSHWQSLPKNQKFITTSFIFDEVVTFLNTRGFHQVATRWGDLILQSSQIDLIEVDNDLFIEGWHYFKRYKDKSFSLTDCISFVVMNKLGLTIALTFDHHFNQAGFTILP